MASHQHGNEVMPRALKLSGTCCANPAVSTESVGNTTAPKGETVNSGPTMTVSSDFLPWR